jgi:hypothetical protein
MTARLGLHSRIHPIPLINRIRSPSHDEVAEMYFGYAIDHLGGGDLISGIHHDDVTKHLGGKGAVEEDCILPLLICPAPDRRVAGI